MRALSKVLACGASQRLDASLSRGGTKEPKACRGDGEVGGDLARDGDAKIVSSSEADSSLHALPPSPTSSVTSDGVFIRLKM